MKPLPDVILSLMLQGNQLKRTARTGWAQRGVPQAENVAAHTYGVAFTALILADLVDEPVDRGLLLSMALLHDLPETLTSDIPTPAWRFLPAGIKQDVELRAMKEILDQDLFANRLMEDWQQLANMERLETRMVHDADKLDMFLQAYVYEQQTGNRQLQEFWDGAMPFYTTAAQSIFDALQKKRTVSREYP